MDSLYSVKPEFGPHGSIFTSVYLWTEDCVCHLILLGYDLFGSLADVLKFILLLQTFQLCEEPFSMQEPKRLQKKNKFKISAREAQRW